MRSFIVQTFSRIDLRLISCLVLLKMQLFLVRNFSDTVNSKALKALLKQKHFKNIFRLKSERKIRICAAKTMVFLKKVCRW